MSQPSDQHRALPALDPPVGGRAVEGSGDPDVDDTVRVRLVDADPERGFIDFAVIS